MENNKTLEDLLSNPEDPPSTPSWNPTQPKTPKPNTHPVQTK